MGETKAFDHLAKFAHPCYECAVHLAVIGGQKRGMRFAELVMQSEQVKTTFALSNHFALCV
jgi:hypothetical protein